MASRNVNVQDSWTVEPELAEHPPRRVIKSDQPNPNQPKAPLLLGIGGVAGLVGLVLLIVGLSQSPSNVLLVALGAVLALGGVALMVMVPQMTGRYFARAERLATHGLPMMARVVSADNMGGDNQYMRLVRYQVPMPNGEMVHRQVYADDRRLPVQIPGNTTALIDLETNDVELYCALPFIAVPKPGAAARPGPNDPLAELTGVATNAPATPTAVPAAGAMNTLNVEGLRPVRPKKADTPVATPATPGPSTPATPTPPTTPPPPTDIESVLGADMVAPPKPAQALPQLDAAPGPARLTALPSEVLDSADPERPVAPTVAPMAEMAEPVAPVSTPVAEPEAEKPSQDETPETPPPAKPAKPTNSGLPWE